MTSVWWRALGVLFAVGFGVYTPVRIFYGLPEALLATLGCLLLVLGWHLFQLGRLIEWLRGPLDAPLPEGGGVWEIAFAGLYRRVRIRTGQQQVLSDALTRFTCAAQALPDGIIVLNRHRHIDWINATAERHFQMSAATDQGQALTNLIRQPEFVSYLEGERYDEPMIYRCGRVEGLTLSLQVIPYGQDQSLLLSRDISHQERLETVRRDFIANVSHELRTPLTVINGFLETLSFTDDVSPDFNKRALTLMTEQATRMQRLIEDLLVLSRLEDMHNKIKEKTVNVADLLNDLLREAESLSAGRHRIKLILSANDKLRGSEEELRSAFSNLISNAIRYTPDRGEIVINWEKHNEQGLFFVQDSGIGIEKEHIPRLTERFYRVDSSRSRETGGTGLGLAIVKHIANRHEARLEITSEVGKGSRFSIWFPAKLMVSEN